MGCPSPYHGLPASEGRPCDSRSSGIVFLAAAAARAALTPDEIGIIGRAGSDESQQLAEHYAEARGVPSSQIFYGDIPAVDELPRATWDSRVRPAIRPWLLNGKLESKIRCLVTLRDVPLKIGRRDVNDPPVKARQEFFAAARESQVKEISRAWYERCRRSRPTPQPPSPHRRSRPGALAGAIDEKPWKRRCRTRNIGCRKPRPKRSKPAAAPGAGIPGRQRPERPGAEPQPASATIGSRSRRGRSSSSSCVGQVAGLEQGLQVRAEPSRHGRPRCPGPAPGAKHHGLLGAVQWIDGEREALEKNETLRQLRQRAVVGLLARLPVASLAAQFAVLRVRRTLPAGWPR